MLSALIFRKHLEDEEAISLIVHKHWLMGIKYLAWPTVSFIFGWLFFSMAPVKFVLYLTALWSVYSLVWWARNFFDYYLDVWIITNHGIIDLDWHGWFHRQSTRVLFSDIQGVSYEINGVMGTLFRYGILSVEKISTGTAISLTHVSKPRSVEGIIMKNMEAYLHAKNMKNAKHVQELLADMVAGQLQTQTLQSKK